MSEETDLVKAVAEGTAKGTADAALEPLKALLMPFCQEVGEGLGQYGTVIKERLRLWAERALKMLREANLTPEPMPVKLFVPIAQNAALEDDEFLQESWSALLANAANPKSETKVHQAFPGILKELTPAEAQLLNNTYAHVCREIELNGMPRQRFSAPKIELWGTVHEVGKLHSMEIPDLEPMLEHLAGLILFDKKDIPQYPSPGTWSNARLPTHESMTMTAFGFEFVTACPPPGYSPWMP